MNIGKPDSATLRRLSAALWAAMLCGCGPEEMLDRDEVAQGELASAFGNNASGGDADGRFTFPWTSPGTVNVCYVGPVTGGGDTDAPSATRMATAHAAVTSTWQRTTGLTFSNQGRCPTTIPTSWISVFIEEVNGNGNAEGGVGARLDADARWNNRTDIQAMFGDRPGEYLRQVVHEFGHALGFYHELDRAESKGTDCDGTGTGTGNLLGRITPYDRDSIMIWSYCSSIRTETELLSPLDELGGEMMYPKTQSGHALSCADGCVTTASGVIVRSNGGVTIDWVRRGANVDPTWTFAGTTLTPSDGILRATSLAASSTSVTMTFPDAFSNPNLGLNIPPSQRHALLTGGGTVIKSDAQHTAVIMTAIDI